MIQLRADQEGTVSAPVIKVVTAWLAAIGVASWSDLAAALAALYSLILLIEWFWNKSIHPALERRGLLVRKRRRRDDYAT